jgi:hypothetical protein
MTNTANKRSVSSNKQNEQSSKSAIYVNNQTNDGLFLPSSPLTNINPNMTSTALPAAINQTMNTPTRESLPPSSLYTNNNQASVMSTHQVNHLQQHQHLLQTPMLNQVNQNNPVLNSNNSSFNEYNHGMYSTSNTQTSMASSTSSTSLTTGSNQINSIKFDQIYIISLYNLLSLKI